MKVKICGLTNKDDAVWALNYGADYLGLNFYSKSPRHISVASAQKWVSQLPGFASLVGLFVDADQKEILKSVEKLKLKGVQLHGNESPEYIKHLKSSFEATGHTVFIIKAVRVETEEDLQGLDQFKDLVDYILLDAKKEGDQGGTGERFDWNLALKVKDLNIPIILAGGLTPDNVKQATKKVQPIAVDVASGVEKSHRKKDLDRMKDFITKAKA